MALDIFIASFVFLMVAFAYEYYRATKATGMSTELKSLRDELSQLRDKQRLTQTDPVTHLLAWHLFKDRISQNIRESERYQFTMGLMLVDLNDFKQIINALGHSIGDKLLKEVASRLSHAIRRVDSVSRLAKDTFVVLLSQLSKPEAAAIVAQRFMQVFSLPFEIDEHELYVTASIGIALYPGDGQDTALLLRSADHALSLAKKEGKNIFKFYQDRMQLQSQRELLICNGLCRESLLQELHLVYQPIFQANQQSIFCMDVLLSWQHPEIGVVPEETLFEYAERQRKMTRIASWILKNACKQFLAWRVKSATSALLSIPLPIKQLCNSNFIYQCSHILQELNFNPEWLLMEIKENGLQESPEMLDKAFNMLSYLGIRVVVDDFGSGSFAQRYLNNGAIRFLKLSRTLTDEVVENEQAMALIEALLRFAQSLSLQVMVQDVTTEQQWLVLKQIGCTLMQGAYFGEPVSGDDVLHKWTLPTT